MLGLGGRCVKAGGVKFSVLALHIAFGFSETRFLCVDFGEMNVFAEHFIVLVFT